MGLSEARRVLQWNVVIEALAAAGVDAETVAMVEQARHVGDVVQSMAQVLLGTADSKQAKNYVKVEMVGLIAPFERAYVELVRPGGRTSHELRELLRERLEHVRATLANGSPSDGTRQGLLEWIDEALVAEAP